MLPTSAMSDGTLPTAESVGVVDTWVLPLDSGSIEVEAKFLGLATSRRNHHHPGRSYVLQDRTCGGCRWFEPRIFREAGGQRRYLVYLAGMTIVPGESPRIRYEWALSGHEVVEILTTRRRDEDAHLSKPAALVLAQAAAFDSELNDAWVNRAVE